MKKLNEDYGQSQALDEFVGQAYSRFKVFYKVSFDTKEYENSTKKHQEEYFAFKDAATSYYNGLLEDAKTKYNWFYLDAELSEIRVALNEEELESDYVYGQVDEESEDIIEDDTVIEDDTLDEE